MKDTVYTDTERDAIFQHLLSNELEEFIRINPDTGMGYTVQATSERWQKTKGISYPFEETMKTYILSFSSDSKTEDLIHALTLSTIKERLKTQEEYKVFYTIQTEDSSFRIKKATFFPKGEKEIWLILRDITADYNEISNNIFALDDALQSTSRELNRKNTFINLMSRNIRIPLYSIMGLTQITEESAQNNTALDAYLHKISMSGTYMSDTIDDILELRRITNREITLEAEPIRLYPFLQRLRQTLDPVCRDKNLIFGLSADFDHHLVVDADAHALRQIFTKLLYSAFNYTVSGGRIQLSAYEIMQNETTVTIEFSVNCIGIVIDQERLKTIFQPYHYLLEKIDDDIGSLDIGLIILKRYALAMGTDTLTAETDESIGTKVSLTLTLNLSKDTRLQKEESIEDLAPKLKGLRILVVDDNDTNLEVTKKILTSKKIFVKTAQNGQEALDIYRKEKGAFDLILMDVIMPVMDGLEAARKIRTMKEIPHSETIPIIAMTANAFRKNFEESFQAGMNAHLVKPISQERLFFSIASSLFAKPPSDADEADSDASIS